MAHSQHKFPESIATNRSNIYKFNTKVNIYIFYFRSKEKGEKNNNLLDDIETDEEEIISSKHFMELKNDVEEKESTIKVLKKKYV